MSFGPGGVNASEVHVGANAAEAVYLGAEKVWPEYEPVQSPWYTPTPDYYNTSGLVVAWPAGAKYCDIIGISGGGGGGGTGIAGSAARGGAAGVWAGQTLVQSDPPTAQTLQLCAFLQAGKDGVGGGNFNTDAAAGSFALVKINSDPNKSFVLSQGGAGSGASGRNGGNVAPTFDFNGRTYTLASYGAGAGQGGASSNKNGSSGTTPGGGGQGADNGGLTGYSGGNGAHAAFILYWY